MRVFLWKGARIEIDIVSVEEVLWDMGRLIWIAGVFRISGAIDSSKGNFSAMGIAEVALFNCESQGSHHVRIPDSRTAITQEPAPKRSRKLRISRRDGLPASSLKAKRFETESSINDADRRVTGVTDRQAGSSESFDTE
jgi:hypothetical protein